MARPKKNNADYFPHDTTMRNDRKIKALRGKFGTEGYGVYNMLLEVLTENENFELILDDFELNLLAGDFGVDFEKLKDMVSYMVELRLLVRDVENNCCSSQGLKKRMQPVLDQRERKRVWASNRWQEQQGSKDLDVEKDTEEPKATSKSIQSKVKESKVNKSKVDIYSQFEFFKDDEFKNLYHDFLEMRKKKKKPATERAEKIIISKLHSYQITTAKKMLEKSIINSWTDIYEIQEQTDPARPKKNIGEIPLHDGGRAVWKWGKWVDPESGATLDPAYYPEITK